MQNGKEKKNQNCCIRRTKWTKKVLAQLALYSQTSVKNVTLTKISFFLLILLTSQNMFLLILSARKICFFFHSAKWKKKFSIYLMMTTPKVINFSVLLSKSMRDFSIHGLTFTLVWTNDLMCSFGCAFFFHCSSSRLSSFILTVSNVNIYNSLALISDYLVISLFFLGYFLMIFFFLWMITRYYFQSFRKK